MTLPENEPQERGIRPAARDILAALVCALVGLILAIEPHLTMLARHGTPAYFGDGDDVLYTTLARAPYRAGWALQDPFCPAWEPQPTLYSWLQFVPLAKLTAGLGIDRLLMPLVWRALGGPMLGLAVYGLFRKLLATTRRPVFWALGCALICLADSGFAGGQTLFGAVGLIRAIGRGDTPMRVPNALGQFRVVTPLLNLPLLLGLATVLIPPVNARRGWRAALVGAVLFGLCVYLYFFFWTAAALTLGVAFLGWLVLGRHSEGARRERNLVGIVLVGGMVLGSPQILSNARTFSEPGSKPILQRMNRGRVLSSDDPARSRYLANYWVFAKLGLGAVVILSLRAWDVGPSPWRRHRAARGSECGRGPSVSPPCEGGARGGDAVAPGEETAQEGSESTGHAGTTPPNPPFARGGNLGDEIEEKAQRVQSQRLTNSLPAWRLAIVWAFTASGYLLANSAIVSGLEFENFHWSYVHTPFGEVLALGSLAMVLDRLRWDTRWLWALPVMVVGLGLFWRPYEAIHCRESALYNQTLRDLLPLRPALARLGPNDVLAGPWQAGVAVMLGDSGLLYQYDQTLVTSFIPTHVAYERKALSAWLRGLTLEESLDELRFEDAPRAPDAGLEIYTDLFFTRAMSGKLLKQYRPNYLLRPHADGPPDDDRGGPWRLVETRGAWSLWRR